MNWYQEEDEEDLMFSPALLARRASESWIETPPIEVGSTQINTIPFTIISLINSLSQNVPINVTLQRKKSLPDVQQLPAATSAMSREEVAFLGSARREEIRRQRDDTDRLRANPLLYLVSPPVRVSDFTYLNSLY